MILPAPHPSFRWIHLPSGDALVCGALEPIGRHVFTTRQWPLGLPTAGADDESGWRAVAEAVDVDLAHLVRVRQVHGAAVDIWRARDSDATRNRQNAAGQTEADIVVTDDPRLAVAVRVADCVPLLVGDRRTGAVAAAHAGWRGIAAGVPHATVSALAREFGSDPADLVAAIGPAISACCYEVGRDVRERVADTGASEEALTRWFLDRPRTSAHNPPMPNAPSAPRSNHWYFDCWAATREGLESAGVPTGSIHVAQLCTASHPDVLCSYRRDGSPAGRLAAVIRAGTSRGAV